MSGWWTMVVKERLFVVYLTFQILSLFKTINYIKINNNETMQKEINVKSISSMIHKCNNKMKVNLMG